MTDRPITRQSGENNQANGQGTICRNLGIKRLGCISFPFPDDLYGRTLLFIPPRENGQTQMGQHVLHAFPTWISC